VCDYALLYSAFVQLLEYLSPCPSLRVYALFMCHPHEYIYILERRRAVRAQQNVWRSDCRHPRSGGILLFQCECGQWHSRGQSVTGSSARETPKLVSIPAAAQDIPHQRAAISGVCACGKPFRKERGKKERWTLFASDSLAHIRTSLACAFFNFLNLTYVYTCVCVCGRTHFFDRNRVLRITSMALGPTLRSTAG